MNEFYKQQIKEIASTIIEAVRQFDKEWTAFEESRKDPKDILKWMAELRVIVSRMDGIKIDAEIIKEIIEEDT